MYMICTAASTSTAPTTQTVLNPTTYTGVQTTSAIMDTNPLTMKMSSQSPNSITTTASSPTLVTTTALSSKIVTTESVPTITYLSTTSDVEGKS